MKEPLTYLAYCRCLQGCHVFVRSMPLVLSFYDGTVNRSNIVTFLHPIHFQSYFHRYLFEFYLFFGNKTLWPSITHIFHALLILQQLLLLPLWWLYVWHPLPLSLLRPSFFSMLVYFCDYNISIVSNMNWWHHWLLFRFHVIWMLRFRPPSVYRLIFWRDYSKITFSIDDTANIMLMHNMGYNIYIIYSMLSAHPIPHHHFPTCEYLQTRWRKKKNKKADGR